MKLSPAQQNVLAQIRQGRQPRNRLVIEALLRRDLIEIEKRYISSYQIDRDGSCIPGTEVWHTDYRVK